MSEIWRVARPSLSGDVQEVISCADIIPRNGPDSLASGSDTTRGGIKATLIIDFSETVGKVEFSPVSIEL